MSTRPSVGIDAGAASSTGHVRTVNEDAWLVHPRLFCVADGMGGHAAGDRASALAIGAMTRLADGGDFTLAALIGAVVRANQDIALEGAQRRDERGMGTTLTGVAVVPVDGHDQWVVFNVGDSRVYLHEGDTFGQVSVDHSEVQEMVDAGRITREEARHHPLSNVVTRSLGRLDAPLVDHWTLPIRPGQSFLVCSDGISLEVSDDAIREHLGTPASAQECAEGLVAAADAAGGHDNSTAVVVAT